MVSPLVSAAQQLKQIVEDVEARQEANLPVDDLLIPFQDASVSFQGAVDRRVWLLKQLQSSIDNAKDSARYWQNKARYLEKTLERLEEETIETIKDEAVGITTKIRVCTSGGKQAVRFKEDLQPGTIARIVDEKSYPSEYLDKREVFVLKPEFEDDLRAGKFTTEAAYVAVRKKHLRLS